MNRSQNNQCFTLFIGGSGGGFSGGEGLAAVSFFVTYSSPCLLEDSGLGFGSTGCKNEFVI